MNSTTFTFTPDDKVTIFVRKWLPQDSTPRAAVQIAHGAAEHSQRYERFASALTGAGFIVYANDHRGHGQTAATPDRAGVAGPDGWNGMVRDLHQLSDIIREEHPNLPLFLFGHSLGSLMTQQYIQQWGEALAGTVLCGTFGESPGLEEFLPALKQAADAAPDAPSQMTAMIFAEFNKPFEPAVTGFEWLSRDTDEVKKYVEDPWCGHPLANQLVYENALAGKTYWSEEAESRIPKHLPILFIAGDQDPCGGVNAESVKALSARYRQQGIANIEEIFYPGARHEILNETIRDQVEQDVVSWLHQQL